ncbi:MAG TPA: hypothetical protein VJB34_10435 [Bdellovibrionota bacterium]|nr:hypothetical protein [Bdellovibrionota bacterium]
MNTFALLRHASRRCERSAAIPSRSDEFVLRMFVITALFAMSILFSFSAYANDPEMEQSIRARMQRVAEEILEQDRARTASGKLRIQDAEADALAQLKPEAIGYLRRMVAQGVVAMYGREAAPVSLTITENFRTVVGEFLKALLFQLANGTASSKNDAAILQVILQYPEILKEIDTAQKIYAAYERGDLRLDGLRAKEWAALVAEEERRQLSTEFNTEYLPDIAREFRDHRAFPLSESTASVFSFYAGYSPNAEKSFPTVADLTMSFFVVLDNAGMTQIKQSEMDVIDGLLKLCMMMKKSGALDNAQAAAQFRTKFEAFWIAVMDYYTSVKQGVNISDMETKLAKIDALGFETFGSVTSDFGGEHSFRNSESGRRIVENLPFASVIETVKQSKDALRRAIGESGQEIRTEEINNIIIRGYHPQTGDIVVTVQSLFYVGNVLIRGLMQQQVQGASTVCITSDNIIVLNAPYSDACGKYRELLGLFYEISLDSFILSEIGKQIVEHQITTRGIKPVGSERAGMTKRIVQAVGRRVRRLGIRRATEVEMSDTDRRWIEKITEKTIKTPRGRGGRRGGAASSG